MTDADKAKFADRVRRAAADAQRRGLRLTGYRVSGDRIAFDTVPIGRRARAETAAPSRTASRRGVAATEPAHQGALL